MQKRPKISPNTSSTPMRPVRRPKAWAADRISSTPSSGWDGAAEMKALTRLQLGDGRRGSELATAADFDAKGQRFVLRTYAAAYLWVRSEQQSWDEVLAKGPCKLSLERDRQGEAIAIDESGFFTLSEGVGEPIRHYRWR